MTSPEPGALTWHKSSFSNGASACVEVAWRKSSFSNGGTACVEVSWRKSSFSNGATACVEVAPVAAGVAVRDSKHPTGPALGFDLAGWRAFVATTR